MPSQQLDPPPTIIKNIEELNNTINHLDITDIYRTQQPTATEYILFSRAHKIFTEIDHMLGHKTFNKFE